MHKVALDKRGNLSAILGSLVLHTSIGAWAFWPAQDSIIMPQQRVIEVAILMESSPQENDKPAQLKEEKESPERKTDHQQYTKYQVEKMEKLKTIEKHLVREVADASPKLSKPSPVPPHVDTEPQPKSASMPITGLQMENAKATSAAIMPPVFNAAYLENTPPSYPPPARRRSIEGKVLLHVEVSKDGKAESVTVLKTSGSELLDEAARLAVTAWKFVPARRGIENVSAGVTVPIVFSLR